MSSFIVHSSNPIAPIGEILKKGVLSSKKAGLSILRGAHVPCGGGIEGRKGGRTCMYK